MKALYQFICYHYPHKIDEKIINLLQSFNILKFDLTNYKIMRELSLSEYSKVFLIQNKKTSTKYAAQEIINKNFYYFIKELVIHSILNHLLIVKIGIAEAISYFHSKKKFILI